MPPFEKAKPRPVPAPLSLAPLDLAIIDGEEPETVSHYTDPDLLLFRTFRGYVRSISTDMMGELTMRVGVVPEDKADAFALTDFTGLVFTFDAYFRPRRNRADDDADEDDEDAGEAVDGWPSDANSTEVD